MKPLVIYHASCADGFAAAFAAWLKLGDEAIYCPRQYGQTDPLPDYEGRETYIFDFSFPREDMAAIFAYAKRVTWLDHHKTAFEMWCGKYEKGERVVQSNGRDDVILDDNKSGAILAWAYFHPGTEVPMLFRHIDDRDRWIFAIPGSKEVNAALWSLA